jgi:AcrR family transcriptional regulator
MARPSNRDRILDALEDELLERGPEAPSLEAVATRAGVSKGGLLYHFPAKELLLDALVRRWAERADAEIDEAASSEGFASAWLRASAPAPTPASSREARLGRSLAALVRTGPPSALAELVTELTERYRRRLAEDVGDPVLAEIIRLVGDGLFFAHLVGAPQPDPALLERVRLRLLPPSEDLQQDRPG